MKIKARLNKIHRVNPNSIKCKVYYFERLKEGKTVDLPNDAAEELLNMGVANKANNKKVKRSK